MTAKLSTPWKAHLQTLRRAEAATVRADLEQERRERGTLWSPAR